MSRLLKYMMLGTGINVVYVAALVRFDLVQQDVPVASALVKSMFVVPDLELPLPQPGSHADACQGFRTYVGPGFSMRLPSDATVRWTLWPPSEAEPPGAGVLAVAAEAYHASREVGERYSLLLIEGPKSAYEMWIWKHENADRTPLMDFVRERTATQVAWADLSLAELARLKERFTLPATATVAGTAVWYLGYSPDALVVHYFLGRGRDVVEFRYFLEGGYGDLLVCIRELYAFILRTFRWLPEQTSERQLHWSTDRAVIVEVARDASRAAAALPRGTDYN